MIFLKTNQITPLILVILVSIDYLHLKRMYVLFLCLYFIGKKLFTSTTYKNYNLVNHYHQHQTEIEKTLHINQTKTSKVITHVYQSVKTFIKLVISYFIYTFTINEVHGSIMGKIYK